MNRKVIGLIIVLGIVAVVVGTLVAPSLFGGGSATGELPSRILDMELQEPVQSGEEAMAQISQLHGTGIEIENAYIADYAGASGHAMLWISESPDENMAEQLLEAMDNLMPGNDVFTGRTEGTSEGVDFKRVVGAGMVNYYYLMGRRVYWLGYSGLEDDSKIVQAFIQAFKSF